MRVPSLRRHARGSGVVRLSGQDHYLGPWPEPDSPAPPEIEERYHELIARWVAGGRKRLPTRGRDQPLLVQDLCDRFISYARADYPPGSREPTQYELAFRVLRELYGHSAADQFDVRGLQLVRSELVQRDLVRSYVNRTIGRIKRLYRWAGREKLAPASINHELATLEPLRKGQRGVKERVRRTPATEGDVEAVCAHLSAPMAAMVWLLWLTGMRPGEVRRLRVEEVDRTGDVWVYRPADHKGDWADRPRAVAIGPRAVEVLRPWLARAGERGPVFSPRSLMTDHLAAVRLRVAGEVLSESHAWALTWFKRVPGRCLAAARDVYSDNGFEASVRTAATAAGRPWFSAYCCRHGVRMKVSREAGDEAARCVLGQTHIDTLSHYGKIDEKLAIETMRKIG